jgi:hypothetical protein
MAHVWVWHPFFAQVVYDPDQVKKERERGGGQVSWHLRHKNIKNMSIH